ncbi:MAG: DUF6286 domain-containing protein [Opitutaceae bacterium]|nr:DUF6286 domain-containing protein [Opitutaceae bacterium]
MFTRIIQFFVNSPVEILILWGLVVVLVVALILNRPSRVTLATGKHGSLQISRHALHRLIEACCEQVKGVDSARVTVSGGTGRFTTRIRLKVRPNAKLDAIQGYLTQEVAAIYRENLGIENDGPVEIDITGVVPEEKGF